MTAAVLSAAILVMSAVVARAQDSAATMGPRCDSILAAARVDSVITGLFFTADRIGGADFLPGEGTMVATAVATALRLPMPWRVEVFDGPSQMRGLRRIRRDTSGELRAPSITGVYRYTSTKAQPVAHAEIARASRVGGLDSAVIAAIRRAATSTDLADLAASQDSMRVQVRVSTDSGPRSRRMFTFAIPRMHVIDAVPMPDNPPAILPPELRGDSLQEEVLLRFVVDRQGLADLSTVELARGRSVSLVRAALEALSAQLFAPASIAGCPVSQVVYYPFSFHSEAEKPPLHH